MVARMAAPAATNCLQPILQSAVQSAKWTYSLFWQLCPQQGILVWGEGYYNGPIKTRKTVQPMEVSTEEATLHRSEQLRELYDSLSAGETNQPARRPSAALSPEDLTESEWFYLMCVSFSFPPGVDLPGKAYAKQKHVWLVGACEADSKVFARAILAKSARIQTVVCIPLLDGVVELGTTEKVLEDIGLVQRVKSFFIEHNVPIPPKPALSGHSTSNTAMSPTMLPTYTPLDPLDNATDQMDEDDDEDEEEEEDDGDDNEEVGDEDEVESETEVDTGSRLEHGLNTGAHDHDHVIAEPSELMHLDLSEDIRLGSPEDGSNNLDSDFHMLGVSQVGDIAAGGQGRGESTPRWPALDCFDHKPFDYCHQLQESGAPPLEELAIEDTHYSNTVSTILHHQPSPWSDSSSAALYSLHTTQSAFTGWSSTTSLHGPTESTSQWLLKYMLITVPLLHTNNFKSRDGAAESATRFRKGTTLQDELSANHVLAERRRREKLNERFIILRSLVPFVTKMDKASILGDTIEYLKQLRKKIQDLEARVRQPEGKGAAKRDPRSLPSPEKRKVRVVETGKPKGAVEIWKSTAEVQVEVSIIENDALVEMQCPYAEGLLLDVMQVLRELGVEITAVQSSLDGGIFVSEMRAKVKENVNGKKVSIMEVKRAINQIIPHNEVCS